MTTPQIVCGILLGIVGIASLVWLVYEAINSPICDD
jgi:hypothetical protein